MPRHSSPLRAAVEVIHSAHQEGGGVVSSARVALEADEEIFRGHYPGFPIVPGVCLIECAHRSSLMTAPVQASPLELAAVESARFLGPAFPGDVVTVQVDWRGEDDGWRCGATMSTERGIRARARLRYRSRSSREPPPTRATPAAGTHGVAELSVADIRRLVPHRHPMLLVDRVRDVVPGVRLSAVKAVTCSEPWYAHASATEDEFAYPATLLMESWCQAAGVLSCWERPNPDVRAGHVMLFGSVTDARFHRPVLPGEVLNHQVRVSLAAPDAMIFEGVATVADELAMTVGRVVIALRPAALLMDGV